MVTVVDPAVAVIFKALEFILLASSAVKSSVGLSLPIPNCVAEAASYGLEPLLVSTSVQVTVVEPSEIAKVSPAETVPRPRPISEVIVITVVGAGALSCAKVPHPLGENFTCPVVLGYSESNRYKSK
jgi:hypothetical protein